MDCLLAYDYSGNVRELKNALERALIMADGAELRPEFLPPAILKPPPPSPSGGLIGHQERELFR